MTPQERTEKLESFRKGPEMLKAALAKFPRNMWDYKPSPERWSIHEIIVHVLDSDINGYIRCRKLIAEPGSAVTAFDQEAWTKTLHYDHQSVEDAIEGFKVLREATYTLLRAVPEKVWNAHTVHHPEFGILTMDRWLDTYERHVEGHIGQMKKTYDAWEKAGRP